MPISQNMPSSLGLNTPVTRKQQITPFVYALDARRGEHQSYATPQAALAMDLCIAMAERGAVLPACASSAVKLLPRVADAMRLYQEKQHRKRNCVSALVTLLGICKFKRVSISMRLALPRDIVMHIAKTVRRTIECPFWNERKCRARFENTKIIHEPTPFGVARHEGKWFMDNNRTFERWPLEWSDDAAMAAWWKQGGSRLGPSFTH